MATVTRTYIENQYTTNKCTWTVTYSLEDSFRQVSDIRTDLGEADRGLVIPYPTVQVKITGTTKTSFEFWLTLKLTIGEPPAIGETDTRECVEINYERWQAYGDVTMNKYYSCMVDGESAISSGAGVGSLVGEYSDLLYLKESALSNTFGNATGSVPIQVEITDIRADSYVGNYESTPTKYNSYIYSSDTGFNSLVSNDLGTLGVDAPPQITIGEPTYEVPQYAGLGAYIVPLTTLTAQYGGKIASAKLSIDVDSTTKTYSISPVTNETISVVPSNAGTYIPSLIVTDSRGQSASRSFPQITVNAYNAPNISFDVQRCDSNGALDVEGEYALVTASISYTNAIAELTQPTVSVHDGDGNLILSNATWYESWTAQNGVQNAVNWTGYNPNSPAKIYGVVSATGSMLSPSESYSISITPNDNMGGSATTITQTLATSFFTIDFQAGGKEIAFGAPANDDLTDFNGKDYSDEGLFKCNMGTAFNDMTSQEVGAFVDELNFIGIKVADFVVEEGTDGIWTYRKWNSGIAECWGTYEFASASFSATGSVYYRTIGAISYPSGLFVALPHIECSVQMGNAGGCTITNASTSSVTIGVLSSVSTARSGNIFIRAIGTWK